MIRDGHVSLFPDVHSNRSHKFFSYFLVIYFVRCKNSVNKGPPPPLNGRSVPETLAEKLTESY